MFIRKVILVVVFVLAAGTNAYSHSPSALGHGPVKATVLEKSGNDLIVKTKKGKYLVRRAHAAEIFRGRNKATLQDINVDDKIRLVVARTEPGRVILPRTIFLSLFKSKEAG